MEGIFEGLIVSFKFCDVARNGDHPEEEEVGKFGYRSERKVEIFKNSAVFWRPWNLFSNMAILEGKKKFSKFDDFDTKIV